MRTARAHAIASHACRQRREAKVSRGGGALRVRRGAAAKPERRGPCAPHAGYCSTVSWRASSRCDSDEPRWRFVVARCATTRVVLRQSSYASLLLGAGVGPSCARSRAVWRLSEQRLHSHAAGSRSPASSGGTLAFARRAAASWTSVRPTSGRRGDSGVAATFSTIAGGELARRSQRAAVSVWPSGRARRDASCCGLVTRAASADDL